MVSTMHCYKKTERRLLPLLLLLLLVSSSLLQAAEFQLRDSAIREVAGRWLLDATIDYHLSETAREALSSGVPITLQLDLTVERQRRYWFNQRIRDVALRWQLRHHPLSGQYLIRNLNSGNLSTYPTLDSALEAIGHQRDLLLLQPDERGTGDRFEVELQSWLDIEALPAPLRPIAYVTAAWRLNSERYQWRIKP